MTTVVQSPCYADSDLLSLTYGGINKKQAGATSDASRN